MLVWSFLIFGGWESFFLNFKLGHLFKTTVGCCTINSISVCLEQEKEFPTLILLHHTDYKSHNSIPRGVFPLAAGVHLWKYRQINWEPLGVLAPSDH